MSEPSKFVPASTLLERSQGSSQFDSLLVMAVIGCTTGFLLLLAPDMNLPLKICLAAVILLTLKYWGSVSVFLAVQVDLFFREPRRSETFQGFTGVLTVCLIVGLLMFINRNREILHRAASLSVSLTFQRFINVFRGEIIFDSGKAVREISQMMTGALRGTAVLAGCVFVSRMLLNTLPDRRSFNDSLQTWMLDQSSVPQFSMLLVAIVAAWLVCNEISWRQLTGEQAKLYLRSVFLIIHHADLRQLVRRRLKLRRKAARELSNLKSPHGILNQKNYAGEKL